MGRRVMSRVVSAFSTRSRLRVQAVRLSAAAQRPASPSVEDEEAVLNPERACGADEEHKTVDECLDEGGGVGRYQLAFIAFNILIHIQGSFWVVGLLFSNLKLQPVTHMSADALNSSSSLLFVGWGLGAMVGGSLTDKIGRYRVMFASLVLGLAASLVPCVLPSFPVVCATRVLVGVAEGGLYTGSYILLIEVCGAAVRGRVTVCMNVGFSGGLVLLSLVSMLFRDSSFRVDLLVQSSPSFILVLAAPLFHESPRFLLANGHPDKALAVLRAIAKANGSPLPPDITLTRRTDSESTRPRQGLSIGKLLLPSLRLKVASMCMCWFTVTIVYYGLSFVGGKLAGDVYTNTAMLGALEIPALLVCLVLQDLPLTGRRLSQVLSFLTSGLSLLLILTVSAESRKYLAMVGKFGASAAFTIIYVYTGELFPTNVRATALGLCNLFARAGGVVAPLMLAVKVTSALAAYGVLALISASLTLLLPETLNHTLREVPEEEEEGLELPPSAVHPSRKPDGALLHNSPVMFDNYGLSAPLHDDNQHANQEPLSAEEGSEGEMVF